MDDRARAEWNAAAWLALTDRELIERSASLGLPGELHPEEGEPSGTLATYAQLAELRQAADKVAADLADKTFVKRWVKENRPEKDDLVRLP